MEPWALWELVRSFRTNCDNMNYITGLESLLNRESLAWETIAVDDGLEYKKYTPGSENENWFSGRKYKGKTIMKFRFSSVLRCFGYRKEDRFRILRIERDHKISDHGSAFYGKDETIQ